MSPLVQLLLYGLVISLILIPVSRWFWKKWDLPNRQTRKVFAEMKLAKEEEEMWHEKEVEMKAEIEEKMKWERKPKVESISDDAKTIAYRVLDNANAETPDTNSD